jgi:LemA protein
MALLKRMRKRLDKIPNLIETVRSRSSGQDQLINELINLRSSTWLMNKPTKNNVQNQLKITEDIHRIWSLTKQFPELNRETNFLALKMEFKQIGDEIEKHLDAYNKKVRKYNKITGFIFFLPLIFAFRLGKMYIFEFES